MLCWLYWPADGDGTWSVGGDAVDGGVDERPTAAAAAAADCSTTSQRTSSSSADTSSSSVEPSQQTSNADRVEPERRAENCSSDTGEDSRSQDRRGLAAGNGSDTGEDSGSQDRRGLAAEYTGEDSRSQDRRGLAAEYTGEDSRSQDRRGLAATELTLILRLQRDLATMQLQLSHLQDAMRTANATLQLLLHRAFNDYS